MIDTSRLNQRVVITGIGPVTPIGIGVDAFWDSLRSGRSGVDRIQAYDPSAEKVQIAAEVLDFDPESHIQPKAAKRMARFAQMAVVAARLALDDSGLDLGDVDRDRVAAVINSGGGGMTTIATETETMARRGSGRVSPFFVPLMAMNMASCQVSIELGLGGPAVTSAAACASSIYAFQDASVMMRLNEADLAFSGGTESNISVLGIAGLANMHALSRDNDNPRARPAPSTKPATASSSARARWSACWSPWRAPSGAARASMPKCWARVAARTPITSLGRSPRESGPRELCDWR